MHLLCDCAQNSIVILEGFIPNTGLIREFPWYTRLGMRYLMPWAPFATSLQQGTTYSSVLSQFLTHPVGSHKHRASSDSRPKNYVGDLLFEIRDGGTGRRVPQHQTSGGMGSLVGWEGGVGLDSRAPNNSTIDRAHLSHVFGSEVYIHNCRANIRRYTCDL